MSEIKIPGASADKTLPMVVYVLYLVSLLIGGIPALIGLVMAYINRGAGPAWHDSHYRFQIRTFWIALLFLVIAGLTLHAEIAVLLGLLTAVWFVVRCIKGMMVLNRGQSHPEPGSWLFG